MKNGAVRAREQLRQLPKPNAAEKSGAFEFFVSFGKNPPSLVSSLRSETQLAGAAFEVSFIFFLLKHHLSSKILQKRNANFSIKSIFLGFYRAFRFIDFENRMFRFHPKIKQKRLTNLKIK
ncbi:hypothetical protein [Methanimicrococcus hongohii]|uniref:hypothetical protein n=1 Tax=Methanimicrococcus hongohii TaxID=3028295 RepID=UPI00292EA5F9|nr:hypothetical protein [Methanimicrococcus sp. Hf6]